ncbi:hypothetical protein BD310DRAFT_330467 [Dichomitus squalens]|uniref:Uncharacterized protein n=1 Tax=Dichomitus squalens TaxID=114155 RepID=A0A4Q9Q0D1_9APHY|nr:hypothetical protein BD310DRAFT_330467 [Dichomitus squalens]
MYQSRPRRLPYTSRHTRDAHAEMICDRHSFAPSISVRRPFRGHDRCRNVAAKAGRHVWRSRAHSLVNMSSMTLRKVIYDANAMHEPRYQCRDPKKPQSTTIAIGLYGGVLYAAKTRDQSSNASAPVIKLKCAAGGQMYDKEGEDLRLLRQIARDSSPCPRASRRWSFPHAISPKISQFKLSMQFKTKRGRGRVVGHIRALGHRRQT